MRRLAINRAVLYTFLLETFGGTVPSPASQVDWEMALGLPLGVLANKLIKIEGELRFLAMKAAEQSGEDRAKSTQSIDAKIETMHQALESIHSLLARLQSDFHPTAPAAPTTSESNVFSTRKPSPEWDD
jgi:hypothetical protein